MFNIGMNYMVAKKIKYEFHHMGLIADKPRGNERYSPKFKMYTSDGNNSIFRIQWHRYELDSPLHPLMKTMPHLAFKVENLTKAVEGKVLLLGPYEPLPGFHVAVIEEDGMPVELIQTKLTDEEIWGATKVKSELYPDGNK
jgi:hypothetical protein